jgi:dUTP pyrophosphatase
MMPTGIKIQLPEGYEAQVRPRSGRAIKEGLMVLNSPGTVDADFTGEIHVLLLNSNPAIPAKQWVYLMRLMRGDNLPDVKPEDFIEIVRRNQIHIKRGERIAQLVLAKYESLPIDEVAELQETDRGAAGFGSTGN